MRALAEGFKKKIEERRKQTHCKHGHEFTEENTKFWIHKKTGARYRQCRECCNIRERKYSRKPLVKMRNQNTLLKRKQKVLENTIKALTDALTRK